MNLTAEHVAELEALSEAGYHQRPSTRVLFDLCTWKLAEPFPEAPPPRRPAWTARRRARPRRCRPYRITERGRSALRKAIENAGPRGRAEGEIPVEKKVVWTHPDHGTWRQVTPKGSDPVGLSGPGMGREYRELPRAELESGWTRQPPLEVDLVLVDTGDRWQAVYANGAIVCQDHSDQLAKALERLGPVTVRSFRRHPLSGSAEVMEYSIAYACLPDTLAELDALDGGDRAEG